MPDSRHFYIRSSRNWRMLRPPWCPVNDKHDKSASLHRPRRNDPSRAEQPYPFHGRNGYSGVARRSDLICLSELDHFTE